MNPPSYPPPASVPPAPQEKKGMSPLAWVGIGCGGLILLAVAAIVVAGVLVYNKAKEYANNPEKAAAELIVASNPELDKVRQDDAKEEMTLRTKSGDEFTISYKDLKDGKLAYRDSHGQMISMDGLSDLSEVPTWVPRVPHPIGAASVFRGFDQGKETGFYTVETEESTGSMVAHFKAETDKFGFTNSNDTSFSAGKIENVTHTFSNTTREVSLVINRDEGKPAFVRVSYRLK